MCVSTLTCDDSLASIPEEVRFCFLEFSIPAPHEVRSRLLTADSSTDAEESTVHRTLNAFCALRVLRRTIFVFEPFAHAQESRFSRHRSRMSRFYVRNAVVGFDEDSQHEFKGHRSICVEDLGPWAFCDAQQKHRSKRAASR